MVYDSMNLGLSSIHRIIPKNCLVILVRGNYFENSCRGGRNNMNTSSGRYLEMAILQTWLTANIPSDNLRPVLSMELAIDNLLTRKIFVVNDY